MHYTCFSSFQATSLELQCIQMVLHQLEVKEVTGEALNTLIKLIEDRPEWLKVRKHCESFIIDWSLLGTRILRWSNRPLFVSLPEWIPPSETSIGCTQSYRNITLIERTNGDYGQILWSIAVSMEFFLQETLRAPLELYLAGVDGETTNANEESRRKFQVFATFQTSLSVVSSTIYFHFVLAGMEVCSDWNFLMSLHISSS